ncbi:hypothetical protein [Pedobacter agri]|uniref:hypothetical protein n=1 Tax=Pedobacter agri TaxID=454586 RepID=UPI0027875B7A|nr:hypothetical protein [Pedobacter agri]MDQ1142758.1 hypothetical protein [Pedobacter agri]
MKGLSPWALSALLEIKKLQPIQTISESGTCLELRATSDSVWASISAEKLPPIHFRTCYIPSGGILDIQQRRTLKEVILHIESVVGKFEVHIGLSYSTYAILRYSCTFIPSSALFVPFWPREILLQNERNESTKNFGELHSIQRQTRSGIVYLTRPVSGIRMLYFQNLTSLSGYCDQTGTSLSGVVGGKLPEIGLSLPQSLEKPLIAGTPVILSDAYVCIKPGCNDFGDQASDYLNMLTEVYTLLPKPKTQYRPWPKITRDGLKDLIENPGCWSRVSGNSYLNAYLCDYDTPPEIMVQLAVLLPLLDYSKWSGEKLNVTETIKKGLSAFYSKKLKSLVRWHPGAEDKLKGDEEQKKTMVMDSWYLHHPLLNLSRLALDGDNQAKELFLESIGFAIKVAHKFKYEWPVFYKMDTLEVIKAETEPGKGGEQDVAGLYAHVMIQAYELTGKKKFLDEATTAADKLFNGGDDIMYQANNTAFAAGALLRLHKVTKQERYLLLSYRCLASIFQNVQLWDCNYGYAKNYPTFFALFPLSDAPYTAAYEEQEVFCAFHDYLTNASDLDILPSVKLLCGEYIRYLTDRAPFYYPPMLPGEMLSDEVKTGEVERDLWIALEDIHDGMEKSGSVGQEVYGAGNAFGILPRHYIRLDNEPFMIFVDGPFSEVEKSKSSVAFKMIGHAAMSYQVKIVYQETHSSTSANFHIKTNDQAPLRILNKKSGIHARVNGDQKIKISWTR